VAFRFVQRHRTMENLLKVPARAFLTLYIQGPVAQPGTLHKQSRKEHLTFNKRKQSSGREFETSFFQKLDKKVCNEESSIPRNDGKTR